MKSVDDRPGLCIHVLTSLEERKRKDPSNYSHCVLMVDEMAIKQQVTYVPSEKRKVGYVDLGGVLEPETETIAKNALVMMAVGLKKKWKAPIAFFFTAGLTAEVLSTLITHSVDALFSRGIQVRAIVSDGHRSNVAAIKLMGGNMDEGVYHVDINGQRVQHMLDAVHMMKVLRSLFADWEEIVGPHGVARWRDIKNLVDLQVININEDQSTHWLP